MCAASDITLSSPLKSEYSRVRSYTENQYYHLGAGGGGNFILISPSILSCLSSLAGAFHSGIIRVIRICKV